MVNRLDDAVFNDKGEATTRIQLMALSLASTYFGGTYSAPLALNVKVAFTPVGGGRPYELKRRIDLGPADHSVWAYVNVPRYKGSVRVDSDGDGRADRTLPPASNFLAGVAPAVLKDDYKPTLRNTGLSSGITCPPGQCPYRACHCVAVEDNPQWDQSSTGCENDHLHCIWTCAPSGATGPQGFAVDCAHVAEEPDSF